MLGATVGDTRPSLVSLRNVADYARHVVAEARSVDARSAIRMKVPLPGLSVDVISFDGAMAGAAASPMAMTEAPHTRRARREWQLVLIRSLSPFSLRRLGDRFVNVLNWSDECA